MKSCRPLNPDRPVARKQQPPPRETRRRLLQAAEEEFTERGYTGATVARIANRAGVTVQTLYLAWGSKRALLRAYMDSVLAGDVDTPYPQRDPT